MSFDLTPGSRDSSDSIVPPTRATRREAAATAFIVGGALLATVIGTCASGARAPDRCAALFDRYVDLSLQQADDKLKAWERDDRVAVARSKAEASEALRDCAANLTEREADCAQKATNPNEFEQCFH